MNILTKSEREFLELVLSDRFHYPTYDEDPGLAMSVSEKLTEAGIITEKHTKELSKDFEFENGSSHE